jgi:hypothetical protein
MLSREGKNVVVIMLDRAVGSIIPEIFKREDELAEAYKDFTYYGNTVSFGAHTNFGSPSLFGGYDYTPLKMNERKDIKLSEKHDEALKILPMFFSERDFHISLCDLPYAGYYERPAADVFKDIPDTEYLSLTDGQCVEYLSDETITDFAGRYLNDKIKMMSYGFGYNGDISFYREFSTDSEGICWLEKDEFLKYSGNDEEYWNGKSLDEIEFLLDELKAWGDNDVYGFVVEDCINSKVHKEYTNVDKEDEDYEEEEWEESDSCWGYYGDIDEVKVSMFDQAGLDINEFEEENV